MVAEKWILANTAYNDLSRKGCNISTKLQENTSHRKCGAQWELLCVIQRCWEVSSVMYIVAYVWLSNMELFFVFFFFFFFTGFSPIMLLFSDEEGTGHKCMADWANHSENETKNLNENCLPLPSVFQYAGTKTTHSCGTIPLWCHREHW